MPDASTLAAFSVAAVILFIVPGPAVLYVVSRSMAEGRVAGLVSVLGLHAGSVVYVIAAMAGLTAVLVQSATAFTAVKWAGAAYLVYLGIRTLLETSRIPSRLRGAFQLPSIPIQVRGPLRSPRITADVARVPFATLEGLLRLPVRATEGLRPKPAEPASP